MISPPKKGRKPRLSPKQDLPKLTIQLDQTLLDAARGLAHLQGIPVAQLVREALRRYILEHSGEIMLELEVLHDAANLSRQARQTPTDES